MLTSAGGAAFLGLALSTVPCHAQGLEWVMTSPAHYNLPRCAYDGTHGRMVLVGQVPSWSAGWRTETLDFDGANWRKPSSSGPGVTPGYALAHDHARGQTLLFGDNGIAGQTWLWNGTAWSLAATTGPGRRVGHAMANDVLRGRIVLFGGLSTGSGPMTSDTWEWDGTVWSQVATGGPTPRAWHALAFDQQRGATVLFGGVDGNSQRLGDTWEWDGATWTARAVPGPSPRASHALAYDANRSRTVLFGGTGVLWGSAAFHGDTWEWDGTAWSQAATGGPTPRQDHALAFDPQRGRTLLFGGGINDPRNDVWEWDGTTWQERMPMSPDSGFAFSYDERRRRLLSLGTQPVPNGTQPVVYSETEGAWRTLSVGGPQSMLSNPQVFDSRRDRLLLFGQPYPSPLSNLPGETWTWNGSTWAMVSSQGPVNRYQHSLAYDRHRQRVVLYGGMHSGPTGNTQPSDTWEWDGVAWSQRATIGPPGRRMYALAWHEASGRTVVFGGYPTSGITPLGDCWTWDGVAWTQVMATAPPQRGVPMMADDPRRGRVVLYGGQDYPTNYQDTWEWDGASWTQVANSGPAWGPMVYDGRRERMVMRVGDETWELQIAAADAVPFGAGCGTPPLSIHPSPAHPPRLGSTARALLVNVPGPLVLVATGLSRTALGPTPLPLPLLPWGLPGCTLLQSGEAVAAPALPTGPGTATFAQTLPNATVLLGAHLYLQPWCAAPGANPAGLVLGNGLDWRIGV